MKGTSSLSNTVLFFSMMRGVRDNPRIFTFLIFIRRFLDRILLFPPS